MKILFSNPPWWEWVGHNIDTYQGRQGIRAGSRWPFTRVGPHVPDHFQYGHYLPCPFFLTSAAAYAERHFPGAQVRVRDSIARGESYGSFFAFLKHQVPDWLIIETATPSYAHDLNLIREIKALHPSIKIILAGTIVAGADFRRPPEVFAAVRGEYERGVVSIIRDDPQTMRTVDFMLLTREELNALPPPLVDPVCEGRYCDANPRLPSGDQFPHLQIWTSRGCPFKCCFCGWPATMTGEDPDGTKRRSVRAHSPEWVHLMILQRLMEGKDRGVAYKSIYIDDDTFNLTDTHACAISDVMKKVGLPWSAMCRADTIKPETWKIMRDAGCFGVKIGVESGSQRVIREIVNKHLDLHAVEHTHLPLLKELGFVVHTTWTEGLPGETHEERNETHAMIARLYEKGLHKTHQLSGTAEISGTPLHTLRIKGDLARYPGAKIGPGYELSFDGQSKAEHMERHG